MKTLGICMITIALFLCFVSLVSAEENTGVRLLVRDQTVEISNAYQKIVFEEETSGDSLIPKTFVYSEGSWEPMFDGGGPFLQGQSFNLFPSEYEIEEDTSNRVAVLFKGRQAKHGYSWDALVEATSESSFIKVRVVSHLKSALEMSGIEPTIAFWMKKTEVDLHVDQGPISIYGGNTWGNGFPAAYLWDEGKEAIIFFNMTPMTWMDTSNLNRFRDTRVATISKGGYIGLGLHAMSRSGNTIPAGDMVVEYYLYSAVRPEKPTKLEGLNAMVQVSAPLHPSNASWPETSVEPGITSWKVYTDKILENIMRKDTCWWDIPIDWTDPVLPDEYYVDVLRVNAGRPGERGWDFSTSNNFLSPWVGYLRLHTDKKQEEFVNIKVDNLPLFYDPNANLIRHGTRVPLHVGDMAMTWQNLMFHVETIKTYEMLPPEGFNPALGGRFLMAMDGLIDFAHNVDYVFPQWFNPYEKVPIVQNDVPALGKVREPWQVGSYSYLMLVAHEMTRDETYFLEAKESIRYLLNDMEYTERNERYTKTYTDPADFPVTELFGNAYGVVAAQKIFNITGDEEYLRYSRDFLNTLLTLTFWYDDEASGPARSISNLGLFRPHGGAYNPTPWETSEAYVALTVALKYNKTLPIYQLLLKLFNLQRINSFYFFPPTWSLDLILRNQAAYRHECKYLPIEPFYMSEVGGHNGLGAMYMSNIGIWNYLMYEGLGEADNREMMVLNLDVLDGFESSVSSVRRSFVVYNPTDNPREFSLRIKSLKDGSYNVAINDSSESSISNSTYDAAQLAAGIPLSLNAGDFLWVSVENTTSASMQLLIDTIQSAQDKISYAYKLILEKQTNFVLSVFGQQFSETELRGLRISYDDAVMLRAYAEDPECGIQDISGFLKWASQNNFKPKSEWLEKYKQSENALQGSDSGSMLAQFTKQLEEAKNLYDDTKYVEAASKAQEIIDSLQD